MAGGRPIFDPEPESRYMMKPMPPRTETPFPDAAPPAPETLRARAVHRATAELRRGTPVLLAGAAPLVVLAAETAGAQGLAELGALAQAAPVLLLAPLRAAAVLRRPL